VQSVWSQSGPKRLGPALGAEFLDTEPATSNPYDPGGLNEDQLAERQRSLRRPGLSAPQKPGASAARWPVDEVQPHIDESMTPAFCRKRPRC